MYSQDTSNKAYGIFMQNEDFTGKINIEDNEIYSLTRGLGIWIG